MQTLHESDSEASGDRPICMDAPLVDPRHAVLGKGLVFRRGRSSGFTLIEVLTAIGILTLGFVGTFAIVLQSGKLASAGEEDGLV